MNLKETITKTAAFIALASFGAAPVTVYAQSHHHTSHRQQQKNTWRNLAIGSGVLGLLGLVKHDSTLTFLGAGGALYSAYRYDQDRKSQNREDHARYLLFHKGSFTRNGHRYKRRVVYHNHKKYYQFVRVG